MLMETSDEAMALLAARGDRGAFAGLVDRHYDRIYRIAYRMLGRRADAEDLAQEICVGLPGKLRSFRGEAKFTTWLYRVTLNAARDALRASARRGALAETYAEVDALRRAGDAARASEAAWLRRALDALKPDLRETAVLVLDEELTHAEAAEALGVKESTVSWRLMEIRKALRTMAEGEATSQAEVQNGAGALRGGATT
jgi:RNA polymerase sigma-70 factor (ECF subfamily)